jgi:hypothetical protein
MWVEKELFSEGLEERLLLLGDGRSSSSSVLEPEVLWGQQS